MGKRAEEIEQLSSFEYSISDRDFRSLYRDIYQIIDGHFIGLSSEEPLFDLLAVDSSFWEIAGSQAFESHMLTTYGAWHSV